MDHFRLIQTVRRALDLLAKLACIRWLLSLLANLHKRDRRLAKFGTKSNNLPYLSACLFFPTSISETEMENELGGKSKLRKEPTNENTYEFRKRNRVVKLQK